MRGDEYQPREWRSADGVLREVAIIRDDIGGDAEDVHMAEDRLHHAVLRSIAEGTSTDPAACARAALTTLTILDGKRWYA